MSRVFPRVDGAAGIELILSSGEIIMLYQNSGSLVDLLSI